MYSLNQILKGISKPREVVMELNAQLNWLRCSANYYPGGKDAMTADWDYLIILDALRFDVMQEESDLPGELSTVQSRGAGTREWLRGNFKKRDFRDTVYVNANPQLERIGDELDVAFHSVENIWESDWDSDLRTVKPESVRSRAIEAANRYPQKRILVHFVQPHDPFIGPTGKEHDFGGTVSSDNSVDWNQFFDSVISSIRLDTDLALWEQAYRENVRIVLPEVERLFEELDGKFVVSSDHGVLFGERVSPIPVRYHGHRIGIHHNKLLTVPWLEHESGERREVTAGDEDSYEAKSDQAEVTSRLRDLGYVDA